MSGVIHAKTNLEMFQILKEVKMSGRDRWFFGMLTAVPVVAIAAVALAILLVQPTNTTAEPVIAPVPVISVPDLISLDTSSDLTRTLSARGTGADTAAPDLVEVTLGVDTVADDAGTVISENNELMTAVTEQLLEQGVAAEDIQTTGFNMWMEQVYGQTGPTGEVRFHVGNQVRATLRDVDLVGDILQAALDAGANNVNNLTFAVADEEAMNARARNQAIANARTQAEQMALAAGVELGEVISITELGGGASPFDGADVRAQSGGGGGAPISSGGYTASVTVAVVFAITG